MLHGFQQFDFSVFLFTGSAVLLLYRAAELYPRAERGAASVQPVLLFLRRAQADRHADFFDTDELPVRSVHAQYIQKTAAYFVCYRQSEPAGCVQVSEFLHQLSGQPVRTGYSGAGYRQADRHFVLHVSGAQLRH